MKFKVGDRVRLNGLYKREYPIWWNRRIHTVKFVRRDRLLKLDASRGWWEFQYFKKVS